MEMTPPKRLHCPDCLEGNHLRHSVYTPTEWEGGGRRCVCKCTTATAEGASLRQRDELHGHTFYVPVRERRQRRQRSRLAGIQDPAAAKREAMRLKRESDRAGRPPQPNGVRLGAVVWTPERIAEAVRLSDLGLTHREVAERLGAPRASVSTYIKKVRREQAA